MARNSGPGNIGKGVLGVGVGFALYMLVSGLGGGRGFGWGTGPAGPGAGRAPGPAGLPTAPPASRGPAGPVRTQLKISSAGITVDGKAMTLDEAIEAVKVASDVELIVMGDAVTGDVDDLLVALFLAGITWWGDDYHVQRAPRGMDDVRRIREQRRRGEEWMKLSEAEKEAAREAAIEAAKRQGIPTWETIRKLVDRSLPPTVGISGNARGYYGRGRRG